MVTINVLQLIMDIMLMVAGGCIVFIIQTLIECYHEIKEKYFSTEAQLDRAASNWEHNSWSAFEQFKDDVRKVTRR